MITAPPITAKEFFEQIVEAPPDDTCRTCEFWELDESGYGKDWGKCNNPDVDSRSSLNDWGEIAHTHDFGCRFHRAKG